MRRRTSFFAFLFTSLLLCTLLTGCATAPVSDAPSPQLTYAELLDTVMQTSEGGIDDYLTWCGVWNVLDGCLWACGGWRDADDPQNDRDDLLVSASQENDDASCLQLTLAAGGGTGCLSGRGRHFAGPGRRHTAAGDALAGAGCHGGRAGVYRVP